MLACQLYCIFCQARLRLSWQNVTFKCIATHHANFYLTAVTVYLCLFAPSDIRFATMTGNSNSRFAQVYQKHLCTPRPAGPGRPIRVWRDITRVSVGTISVSTNGCCRSWWTTPVDIAVWEGWVCVTGPTRSSQAPAWDKWPHTNKSWKYPSWQCIQRTSSGRHFYRDRTAAKHSWWPYYKQCAYHHWFKPRSNQFDGRTRAESCARLRLGPS